MEAEEAAYRCDQGLLCSRQAALWVMAVGSVAVSLRVQADREGTTHEAEENRDASASYLRRHRPAWTLATAKG